MKKVKRLIVDGTSPFESTVYFRDYDHLVERLTGKDKNHYGRSVVAWSLTYTIEFEDGTTERWIPVKKEQRLMKDEGPALNFQQAVQAMFEGKIVKKVEVCGVSATYRFNSDISEYEYYNGGCLQWCRNGCFLGHHRDTDTKWYVTEDPSKPQRKPVSVWDAIKDMAENNATYSNQKDYFGISGPWTIHNSVRAIVHTSGPDKVMYKIS